MVSKPDFLSGGSQDHFRPELQVESPEGELHLRFYIPSRQEFALPATGIREVMELSPDRITPIPNASPLLLGTLNLRGRVIWVADLGQFLGEATALNTDRAEIPVIAIEEQDTIVGLAVEEIGGMDWLDVQHLMLTTHVPDTMAPFLRGEWLIDAKTNKSLRLLDQMAILRSARWAG
ncbi:chemotaxis protein CheW [Tolypothrix tenuis PCC 7101]|uniref:Chemotaxis protein CheW n=1 Tax=Tolypothrix tenuis PCC 7101 TaxID=231146 RepID=A0A1Z4N9G6_9CYAN|nr:MULTISPECIES: chemotaxis protein CheW [unclassified Tolypothrix]MBD2163061.1 purine-binding chemotaxis protein CheW [Calothrix membranacea FACHB-236]MBD2238123.1 purine-binding chemotaxis protein CheW [Aulosira sp. FACHB-113]BAY92507.1 chemotaxis protein CheW [Microchaete diplosiphon NIES-3275]BAZ02373.1 chemotaxis protein CheW [Tolypothrix tenuis PCC 7101]BAZ73706.1 chemotaxis protein CheW [Aulosira laxa NIES-50]